MLIDPIPIRLRDGREAVLRCPASEDAGAFRKSFLVCVGETDFLCLTPEEVSALTVEDERRFWGLGIGTAMFRAMIGAARARGGVTQPELDFIEGNARARALYERMGFRICSVLPGAIRLGDGTVLNEYRMILAL